MANTSCCNCKCDLGDAVKVMPFCTDNETWCPQCFVDYRVLMEPERFFAPAFSAVKCSGCGMTSVDCGRYVCSQCSSKSIVVLPPKLIL